MLRDRLVTYRGDSYRIYETIYLGTSPIGASIFREPSGPFNDDWEAGPTIEVPLTSLVFKQPSTAKVKADYDNYLASGKENPLHFGMAGAYNNKKKSLDGIDELLAKVCGMAHIKA